ncbi:MAG: MFS transporter [Polyangiaceae bacterium]
MKLFARVRDPNIRVVYVTILALGIAYGLAISIISVYLEGRGLNATSIARLAIFFSSGIMALSVPAGALIRRFGAKAVLVTSLVGYAVAVGAFPLATSYAGYAALRFLDGAFSVGVWVASETIVLALASREDKAYFTSLYALALALGYVIGPILSRGLVTFTALSASFVIAGVLALATTVFVAVFLRARVGREAATSEVATTPDTSQGADSPRPTTLELLWRIKTSCLATFSYGYFQAALVVLLPLYLVQRGLTKYETILAPAFFALGMLLFANLAAKTGDRIGHLKVMSSLGAIGVCAIFSFLLVARPVPVYGIAFLAGAALASVSPVSLALQGLVTAERDLPRAGGLYNAAYALGMLLGPPISGELFDRVSGRAMIVQFAVLWIFFVVFTLVFRKDDPRARQGNVSPST